MSNNDRKKSPNIELKAVEAKEHYSASGKSNKKSNEDEKEGLIDRKGSGTFVDKIRGKFSFDGSFSGSGSESRKFLNINNSQLVYIKSNPDNIFFNKSNFSFLEIITFILSYAIPCGLALFFIFIGETINIIFISSYNNGEMLNAIGIGTLYINTTGYLLGIGLLGGLDTLCAHSFGAGHLKLVGTYTNVSRVVAVCFFLVICLPLSFFCDIILVSIGQSKVVSELAAQYVKAIIPAIFFGLQFYSSQRYLHAINILLPGMIVTLLTAALQPLWCWIFIDLIDLQLYGAGISLSITQFLNFAIVTLYIYLYNPNPDTNLNITTSSVNIKRVMDFLKYGVPSAILFAANWLGVEVMILLSSYLNYESMVANVCLLNLTTLIFMIPMGISYALTILIGQAIGASNVLAAKYLSVVGLCLGLIFIGITNSFIYLYRHSIPYLYTDNPIIVNKIIDLITIYLYFGLVDTLQVVFNGIIKGLGKQKMTSVIVIIVLYPVNIPMAYMFGFVINYGLLGLWYAQFTSIILLAISYTIILLCLDWEDISKRCVVNMQLVADQIEKYSKK